MAEKTQDELKQYEDLNAINFLYINQMYQQFFIDCKEHYPHLSTVIVESMFKGFIKTLWEEKMLTRELMDTKNKPLILMDQLPLWTQERHEAIENLKLKLDKIFEPIIAYTKKEKLFLYSKQGVAMASLLREVEGVAHPSLGFINRLPHLNDMLFSHYDIPDTPYFDADVVFGNVFWGALSKQYALNYDGRNTEIYLPLGDIRLNSIFWDQELQVLMQEKNKGEKVGELYYFQLKKVHQDKIKPEIDNETAILDEVKVLRKIVNSTHPHFSKADIEKEAARLADELEAVRARMKAITEVPQNWEPILFQDLTFKDATIKVKDMFKFVEKFKSRLKLEPVDRPEIFKTASKKSRVEKKRLG